MKPRPLREDFKKEFPNSGFYRTQHHEALENWAEEAEKKLVEMQHFIDTTEGLWATDRPELLNDPDKLLFKLTASGHKN